MAHIKSKPIPEKIKSSTDICKNSTHQKSQNIKIFLQRTIYICSVIVILIVLWILQQQYFSVPQKMANLIHQGKINKAFRQMCKLNNKERQQLEKILVTFLKTANEKNILYILEGLSGFVVNTKVTDMLLDFITEDANPVQTKCRKYLVRQAKRHKHIFNLVLDRIFSDSQIPILPKYKSIIDEFKKAPEDLTLGIINWADQKLSKDFEDSNSTFILSHENLKLLGFLSQQNQKVIKTLANHHKEYKETTKLLMLSIIIYAPHSIPEIITHCNKNDFAIFPWKLTLVYIFF